MKESPYQFLVLFDPDLNRVWEIKTTGVDNLGHYPYAIDVNGDGFDEVFVSGMMLSPGGHLLWKRDDLMVIPRHAECPEFVDLDDDGKMEIVAAWGGAGLYVLDAATGKTKWRRRSEGWLQHLVVGKFIQGMPGKQIVASYRFYMGKRNGRNSIGTSSLQSQLVMYDCDGKVLWAYPQGIENIRISDNAADFSGWEMPTYQTIPEMTMKRADADGDGIDELYYYNTRVDLVNKVFVPVGTDCSPGYAVDIDGDGLKEIIHVADDGLAVYHYHEHSKCVTTHGADNIGIEVLAKTANHTLYGP